jgi:WXG100 family type VII secretion target
MAEYTITEEAMARGAGTVATAADQVQACIAGLRAEVETMLGGWRGQAAASFGQAHCAFEQRASRINAALRQMHEALTATHRTYSTQEAHESGSLSAIAARMCG